MIGLPEDRYNVIASRLRPANYPRVDEPFFMTTTSFTDTGPRSPSWREVKTTWALRTSTERSGRNASSSSASRSRSGCEPSLVRSNTNSSGGDTSPFTMGPMVGKRGTGSSRLLRRNRQHPGTQGFRGPGDLALLQGVAAPQPAPSSRLGEDEPGDDAVAVACRHRASVLRGTPGCTSTFVPDAGVLCGSFARWRLCGDWL